MGNKKRAAIEMSIGTIVTIVLAISFLVLGIFLIQRVNSSKFTINKTECRNETNLPITHQAVFINSNSNVSNGGRAIIKKISNIEISRILNGGECSHSISPDELASIIINSATYEESRYRIEKRIGNYPYEISLIFISDDNFSVINKNTCYDVGLDITEVELPLIRQICEKKEVQEIFIPNCWEVKYNKDEYHCEVVQGGKNNERTCGYGGGTGRCTYKNISKKDLSAEWLQENCECIEYNQQRISCLSGKKIKDKCRMDKEGNYIPCCEECQGNFFKQPIVCFQTPGISKCQKYSCGENYEVNVK